ncbi:MAG TPA: glycosyltransferase family 4 protein, partial [Spirochaetota bacterium]|nr:glycosyltransferase family 4 protein [Spirochaetota bacterium]
NVFPLISPSIYRFFKKKGVKTVQTIHNYRFLCPNGLFFKNGKVCELCAGGYFYNAVKHKCYKNSKIFSLLYSAIIKLNYNVFRNFIDGHIALTKFTKLKLVDSGFSADKIFIKANGMADKRRSFSESKKYFLYIGRLSKEKGVDFLLDSFSKMPDMKLIIAGDYSKSPEYFEKYKDCPNINFFGFADETQKETLINESLAVIVPSVCYDNYPVALVEAFRAGITAVGSSIGGIPYIISDGVNGELFEPNNFEQFKSKIEKLYNNEEHRRKLSENARSTFLEKMEFSKNITILEEIYKKTNIS